jgi:capsular polysaccharide biosynthesis protein
MELKAYAGVIRRHLWLVVGLPLLVLLVTLAVSAGVQRPQLYRATTTLLVDVQPLPAEPGMGFDPRESAAAAAEYLVDDFSTFAMSEAFARLVAAQLATQGIDVPPGAISGSESSETRHRTLILAVTWPDAAQARAIIAAAGEVAQAGIDQYFARGGVVSVLNGPTVVPIAPPLTEQIELPVRVLLALLVGLGLAFLLDYLDDSVRTVEEAEALLAVPVIGEIPRETPGGILARRSER